MRMRPTGILASCALVALLIAGCGGGGGGSSTASNPNAPVVTNFQVTALTPEKANTAIQYRITATVTDPNSDVLGGTVHVTAIPGGQIVSATISSTFLQGDQFAGVLQTNPVPAGHYDLLFDITDAAGNQSNVLTFTVNVVTELPVGGMPEKPVPLGPPLDSLRPLR